MTEQVFRTPPRATILAVGFLLGAGFFATGAALPSASTGAKIGLGIVALLFLVVAVRCARMRIAARDEGLKLYGPLFTYTIRWNDIQAITSNRTEIDARTFSVRTPVIALTNGRKVKAQPVSSYSFTESGDTPADRIATQLEDIRRAAASV